MDYFFCLFIPHIFIAGSSWTYLEIGWKYEGQNTLQFHMRKVQGCRMINKMGAGKCWYPTQLKNVAFPDELLTVFYAKWFRKQN